MQLLQLHRGTQPGLWRQEKQPQSRRNCCSSHQRTTAVVCISCRDAGGKQLQQIFFRLFFSKLMQEDGYWLYWTKPQSFCSDGWGNGTECCLQHGFGAPLVFSSAGLMLLPSILLRSRSLVEQLAQKMNHIPGACIKLHKVYKRLPNCFGSYLTPEMRTEVFSFPSPATGLSWTCHLAPT